MNNRKSIVPVLLAVALIVGGIVLIGAGLLSAAHESNVARQTFLMEHPDAKWVVRNNDGIPVSGCFRTVKECKAIGKASYVLFHYCTPVPADSSLCK